MQLFHDIFFSDLMIKNKIIIDKSCTQSIWNTILWLWFVYTWDGNPWHKLPCCVVRMLLIYFPVFCLQGLNFIAGLLLLIVKDEESAFWLMDCLINDLLPGRSTSVKFLIKGIPWSGKAVRSTVKCIVYVGGKKWVCTCQTFIHAGDKLFSHMVYCVKQL